MHAMNMESLVYAIVIGVAAGWTTTPMARLMMWVEKLTGKLMRFLRGSVGGVSHYGTTPSYVTVRSRRPWDSRRTGVARGRPWDKPAQLQRSLALLWLTVSP